VRPISTTRSVRDEFGRNLTLNFRINTNLTEVFAGQSNLIRGKNHGIDLSAGIGGKDCT